MTDINKFETSREEAPTLPEAAPTQSEVVQGIGEAARFAAGWQDLDPGQLHAILRAVVTRVQVHSDRIEVTVDQIGIALWLNAKDQPQSTAAAMESGT